MARYRDSLLSKVPGKDINIDSSGPLTLGFRLNSSVNPKGYEEEVVYAKATWVFHMLHMMCCVIRRPKILTARFVALLHGLAEAHRDSVLTTEDLQSAVRKSDVAQHGSGRRSFDGLVLRISTFAEREFLNIRWTSRCSTGRQSISLW